MIKPGLCSVTFDKNNPLEPERVVELVAETGLTGIEWSGRGHVPPGDLDRAAEIGRRTAAAGLEVAAYGSYYRLAKSAEEGLPFERVLETAVALGAPTIRVWPGSVGSADADHAYRRRIEEESRRIGELAAERGVTVGYEYHPGSLTDTAESAIALLRGVNHPAVGTYWQPPDHLDAESAVESLRAVLPWLVNVHVHHFPQIDGARQRLPLAEGEALWRRFLDVARGAGWPCHALIEFTRENTEDELRADAATLRAWVADLEAAASAEA